MDSKYTQVKNYLLSIVQKMEPGAKLPSERELIGRLGFSRATVQRAILDLEQEGVVFRMSRRGTFVADPRLHKSMNRLIGFASEVRAMGGVPGTRLLAFELIEARGTLCEKLGLKEGEGVYYAERLRLKDGVPTVVDHSYFAAFALSGVTAEAMCGSIYSFIESHSGLSIYSADQVITAELPGEEVARVLELPAGEPIIKMEQVVCLADGRPFEYTISYKNPLRYVFTVKAYRQH